MCFGLRKEKICSCVEHTGEFSDSLRYKYLWHLAQESEIARVHVKSWQLFSLLGSCDHSYFGVKSDLEYKVWLVERVKHRSNFSFISSVVRIKSKNWIN